MNKEMEVREKEKGMKGWERREEEKEEGLHTGTFFLFEPWYQILSSPENP